MELIINFFEYTLSGWVYIVWLVLMIIFSLACLGVVGDKVARKKSEELKELRKKAAEEEYKRAQEVLEQQAQNTGVDNVLDPTYQSGVSEIAESALPPDTETKSSVVEEKVQEAVPEIVILDEPVKESTEPVDNTTPIADNVSEEKTEANTTPAVLVIDDSTENNT